MPTLICARIKSWTRTSSRLETGWRRWKSFDTRASIWCCAISACLVWTVTNSYCICMTSTRRLPLSPSRVSRAAPIIGGPGRPDSPRTSTSPSTILVFSPRSARSPDGGFAEANVPLAPFSSCHALPDPPGMSSLGVVAPPRAMVGDAPESTRCQQIPDIVSPLLLHTSRRVTYPVRMRDALAAPGSVYGRGAGPATRGPSGRTAVRQLARWSRRGEVACVTHAPERHSARSHCRGMLVFNRHCAVSGVGVAEGDLRGDAIGSAA